jgi:hypothetical protein
MNECFDRRRAPVRDQHLAEENASAGALLNRFGGMNAWRNNL